MRSGVLIDSFAVLEVHRYSWEVNMQMQDRQMKIYLSDKGAQLFGTGINVF